MTEKGPLNIDQIMNDPSHRSIKKMQLFVGERHPLHINRHWIENLCYLFENRCHITLQRDQTSCYESIKFDGTIESGKTARSAKSMKMS